MQPLTPTTTPKHNSQKLAFFILRYFVVVILVGNYRLNNQLQDTQEKLNNHICNNINMSLQNLPTEPSVERDFLESSFYKYECTENYIFTID